MARSVRFPIPLVLSSWVFSCFVGVTSLLSDEDHTTQLTAMQLYYRKKPAPQKPLQPNPRVGSEAKQADPPPDASEKREATNLGLRWSLLEGDSLEEIDPAKVFHADDHIRLKLLANMPGFLYVLNLGSSGEWHVLFPTGDDNDHDNRIAMDRATVVPAVGTGSVEFDKHPGAEKVVVVLSRKREPDLDRLIESMQHRDQKPKKQDGAGTVMAQNSIPAKDFKGVGAMLPSRDLKREQTRKSLGGTEDAVFVVAGEENTPRVVAEIVLKHE